MLGAPDPFEAARQIWGAVHGAIAFELRGLVPAPDLEAAYRAVIQTVISGLAPEPGIGRRLRACR